MTRFNIRLIVAILTLIMAALVACGGSVSSSLAELSGPAAPQYAITGVAPGYAGAVEISNASRAGQVTVLYFTFVG